MHRRVSRRGRGGGGIHRCGSLRADDCGLIDPWRADFGWDVLRLNQERRRGHERLIVDGCAGRAAKQGNRTERVAQGGEIAS